MDFSLLSQNVIIVIGCPQVWWVSLGLKCLFRMCMSVCLCVLANTCFHWEFYFFSLFFKTGILIISNSDENQ